MAEQALGPPNVFAYGENQLAWAPLPMDGTLEYISLGFATPVYANSVTVRETFGNGFVYQIDLLDTAGNWHTVWAGVDPTPHVSPADEVNNAPHVVPQDALFTFPQTTYLVTGVRIGVDTSLTLGRWEEIDAVTLSGLDPDPGGPPVAGNDSYSIVQDLTLTVPAASGVLINDSDPDNDPLTAVLVSGPAYGTLALFPDGSFTYEPQASFIGTDSFTYKASTGIYESGVATVTISVIARDTFYEINQYASAILGYSSTRAQWAWERGNTSATGYKAEQALGAPNVFAYGANPLAWAPYPMDGTLEYISLGFATPVYANGVTVREISGNGFVYQIDVLDTAGNWNTVWAGTDPTPRVTFTDEVNKTANAVPVDALFAFPETTYLVTGVRIWVNTSTRVGRYEQIDAVTLRGSTVDPGAPPVASNDSYTTTEDGVLVVEEAANGVLGNDTDPDNDPLTAVLVSGPAYGMLRLSTDGSFTYMPNVNFNGIDSFRYKASDGTYESSVATVTITVTPVNDPPVAVNDVYSIPEDTMLVVVPGVLSNDTDPDNDSLTAVLVSPAANGTVILNANGSFSYSPNPDFVGTDGFTYRAKDGLSESGVATVSITVTAVNQAPLAVNDVYSTPEDTMLVVGAPGVLGNDSDVDGPSLSAILVSPAANGTVILNANGSFSYSPNLNFIGTDGFTYKAIDGLSESGVATVSITVAAVNDATVAVNDVYSTPEDTVLVVGAPGVLGNDSDVDGPSLSAILVSPPTNGTVTLNADGSFSYTPNPAFNGTDTFTYKASDGISESAAATVTVDVTTKIINQYASTLLGYSSTHAQWAWERGNTSATGYKAEQALGAPNVFAYGANQLAWAPYPMDGTLEYISLGFATPVYANGVTVREISGNGFVYQIDLLDTAGNWNTVWAGTDPTPRVTFTDEVNKTANAVPVDALFAFPETTYLVTGVRIRVNTSTRLGRYEQIDAVTLHGKLMQ
jgi:VCBS repeat-containing protein